MLLKYFGTIFLKYGTWTQIYLQYAWCRKWWKLHTSIGLFPFWADLKYCLCVHVCYLRCGRSTAAVHGSDRSEMDLSSSGSLMRDNTTSGTVGCFDVLVLLGSLLGNTLREEKHTSSSQTHKEELTDENKQFVVANPVVCPVKSSGYVSNAMDPSVGGGALARIRLTSTFRAELRDKESPQLNNPAMKRNRVGRKSWRGGRGRKGQWITENRKQKKTTNWIINSPVQTLSYWTSPWWIPLSDLVPKSYQTPFEEDTD